MKASGTFPLTILHLDMEPCTACKKFRPFTGWDHHDYCPRCRQCNPNNRCEICDQWGDDRWEMLLNWEEEKRQERIRKQKQRESSTGPGKATAKSRKKPVSDDGPSRKNIPMSVTGAVSEGPAKPRSPTASTGTPLVGNGRSHLGKAPGSVRSSGASNTETPSGVNGVMGIGTETPTACVANPCPGNNVPIIDGFTGQESGKGNGNRNGIHRLCGKSVSGE